MRPVALSLAHPFVSSKVSAQSGSYNCSHIHVQSLLPNSGFYGRRQHGGIDRISLVSQSRASEHRRHTPARHTQIYNMVESETGSAKTLREKPHPLGVLCFRGWLVCRSLTGRKQPTPKELGKILSSSDFFLGRPLTLPTNC